ncbi:MAG: nitroreductase family protein [Chloroflexota bacterium]
MDLMEAIRGRRSIRKYRTDPVPDEVLRSLLEAVRLAPSWSNTQCWRLVVVRDQETKMKLAGAIRTTHVDRQNPATEAVKNAAVVIVACAERGLSGCYKGDDKQGTPSTDKGEWWFMFDMGLAMQNLTLAAHAAGLGTVHIGMYDANEIAGILSLPPNVVVIELMPVGWPDEQPEPRPRKDIEQFTSYDRYSS